LGEDKVSFYLRRIGQMLSKSHLLGGALLLLLAAWTPSAHAVAEAGVPSLIIPPGARANGMGECYVAISEDATAAWWNPGGLAFLEGRNLSLMHSQLVPDLASDVYYEYLGFANRVSGLGTLGFSLIYLTYGESIAKKGPEDPGTPFTSWEGALQASYALELTRNLGFGVSMKYIYAEYAPASVTLEGRKGSGSSFAVDMGALWKLPEWKTNIGASLTNMGPDIAFIDQEQSAPLPLNLRVGAAFNAVSDQISNLTLAFELEQSLVWLIDRAVKTRRSEIWHVGAEYRYVNLLAGRIGYIYDKDGDIKSATFGLGFSYKGKIMLDYASVPQATTLEGRVHRWSVTVSF